jgi:hypothetical protein
MPTDGSISDCDFKLKRFSIEYLAYEYRLTNGYDSKVVYVDDCNDLKSAIADFLSECYSDTRL